MGWAPFKLKVHFERTWKMYKVSEQWEIFSKFDPWRCFCWHWNREIRGYRNINFKRIMECWKKKTVENRIGEWWQ